MFSSIIINETFILQKFIEEIEKRFENFNLVKVNENGEKYEILVDNFYILKNVLAKYIFANFGFPDFEEKNQSLIELEQKVGAKNIEIFRETMREIRLNNLPIEHPISEIFNFSNRSRYNYIVSDLRHFEITYFYNMLNSVQPGYQWSFMTMKDAKKLSEEGFQLECFGSSLNAKLRYFCSVNDVDEPFGRVGDALGTLRKIRDGEKITWRDQVVINPDEKIFLHINPPSSGTLIFGALELIVEILEKHKNVKIIFEAPESTINGEFSKLDKWLIRRDKLSMAWTYLMKKKYLQGKEWARFILEK